MTNYFLLLFIEDTIVFLITLYFYILHNVIATLLLAGWSVSKTHFTTGVNSSGLSSKWTRNKPALVWKPQLCGVQSKLKCSVSHPAYGRVSPQFVNLCSFQIPADHFWVWAEGMHDCLCHRNTDSLKVMLNLHTGCVFVAYLWVSYTQ